MDYIRTSFRLGMFGKHFRPILFRPITNRRKIKHQCILQFIVNPGKKHEVIAEWHQQLAHRDHRGTGRNKIVEHDHVAFLWWLCPKGEHRADTMLRVALGNIFVERYAE